MLHRLERLTSSGWLPSLVALFIFAGAARAHRLDAQAFVRPDGTIEIQTWFSTGEVPRGAVVEIFGPQDQLLASGAVDDQGNYSFSPPRTEALRVVVSAGAGHRRELQVTALELSQALIQAAGSPTSGDSTDRPAIRLRDRAESIPVKEIVLGCTFILALAAFMLSVRNARELRRRAKRTGD